MTEPPLFTFPCPPGRTVRPGDRVRINTDGTPLAGIALPGGVVRRVFTDHDGVVTAEAEVCQEDDAADTPAVVTGSPEEDRE